MNKLLFQIQFYAARLAFPRVSVGAAIPLAQALHESNEWKSPVYHSHNNMFGMKAPSKRPTTATNKGQAGYANYSSPLDSIRDYLYFLDYRGFLTDALLTKAIATPAKAGGYAEDPAYARLITARVASIKADLISPAKTLTKAAAAAALALVLAQTLKNV